MPPESPSQLPSSPQPDDGSGEAKRRARVARAASAGGNVFDFLARLANFLVGKDGHSHVLSPDQLRARDAKVEGILVISRAYLCCSFAQIAGLCWRRNHFAK